MHLHVRTISALHFESKLILGLLVLICGLKLLNILWKSRFLVDLCETTAEPGIDRPDRMSNIINELLSFSGLQITASQLPVLITTLSEHIIIAHLQCKVEATACERVHLLILFREWTIARVNLVELILLSEQVDEHSHAFEQLWRRSQHVRQRPSVLALVACYQQVGRDVNTRDC